MLDALCGSQIHLNVQISIRAIYRSIYEQVFKVLEIENLKMEREFLFVEKRGETAKLQQTFKRFITKDYNV